MKLIIEHLFENANVPEDWVIQTVNHTYERAGLCTGRNTEMMIPLPGEGWNHLWVEVEFEAGQGSAVDCGSDTLLAALSLNDSAYARHRVIKLNQTFLAESVKIVPQKSDIRKAVFDFREGSVRVLLDDEEYVTGRDCHSKPCVGWISLSLWNNCFVHAIRILGDKPVADLKLLPARKEDYHLDVAVDFYDGIWEPDGSSSTNSGPIRFNRAMYDEFFAQLSRCGVRHVPWNYHDLIDADEYVIPEEENIGDSFKLAVEMAHKHGLKIFGTIKPFETQYFARYDKAQPGFLMSRKPGAWGRGENEIIRSMDIVKNDDRGCAFSVDEVSILVSDDNKQYQPYGRAIGREEVIEDYPIYEATSSGPRKTSRTRRSRVMRLSGLNIPHPYIVVSVAGREGSFVNDLVNLVHLFGEKGKERIFTYGTASNTNDPFVSEGGLDCGILFDHYTGGPSGVNAGADAVCAPFALDANQGFLGFERSKKQHLEVLGSPSYPEAREWWLSWVRAILDAGADGIEIRRVSHVSTFAAEEFGFESPVCDEFFKRTGVDIGTTDDFDKALWRRIRGEGYTEFCREAHAITSKAGKVLGLHIDGGMCMEPEEGTALGIHWDWRTWIREGLADYFVLKNDWPGTGFSREVLAETKARGIPLVVSIFLLSLPWKQPGCERLLDQYLCLVKDRGFDGFQYYANAALLRAIPERKRVVIKNPAIREVLARHFKNAN